MPSVDPNEDHDSDLSVEAEADIAAITRLSAPFVLGVVAVVTVAKLVASLRATTIDISTVGFNLVGFSVSVLAISVVLGRSVSSDIGGGAKRLAGTALRWAGVVSMMPVVVIGGVLLQAAVAASNIDATISAVLMLLFPIGGTGVWLLIRRAASRNAL